jgi:23S rRNA (guanosine2251-2'-O)-methyltransferase
MKKNKNFNPQKSVFGSKNNGFAMPKPSSKPEPKASKKFSAQSSHKSKQSQKSQGKSTISLFGFHAVRAALLNPQRDIQIIYTTPQSQDELEEILQEADEQGLLRPMPQIVSKDMLDKACPKEAVHQGVALICKDLPELYLQDLLNQSQHKKHMCLVILDQVTDPHNIGAILRSACAFGIDGLIVQSRHSPDMTGTLAKAASGALEHVPILVETNLSRTIETLQKNGFFVLALDERGRDEIAKAPDFEKCALVMGAEGPGLRPLIRDKCDLLVKLPTTGALSSLNVSNATAIALYALAQKSND